MKTREFAIATLMQAIPTLPDELLAALMSVLTQYVRLGKMEAKETPQYGYN